MANILKVNDIVIIERNNLGAELIPLNTKILIFIGRK